MTFKATIKLPKIELNKDAMKYVRQKAGEEIAPIVRDRVRAEFNDTGRLADSVKYINGKVRPSSSRRPDTKLNNYGLARVLVSRTGKDPFEVDATIEAAGADGAQKGIDEVGQAMIVWDGFGEEMEE